MPKAEYAVRINSILDAMTSQINNDKRTRYAEAEYTRCMKGSGAPATDLDSLRQHFSNQVATGVTPEIQDSERRAAVAEFRCDAMRNSKRRLVEQEFERQTISSNRDLFTEAMAGQGTE